MEKGLFWNYCMSILAGVAGGLSILIFLDEGIPAFGKFFLVFFYLGLLFILYFFFAWLRNKVE